MNDPAISYRLDAEQCPPSALRGLLDSSEEIARYCRVMATAGLPELDTTAHLLCDNLDLLACARSWSG